jgi:SAM-dependent methyltransferase
MEQQQPSTAPTSPSRAEAYLSAAPADYERHVGRYARRLAQLFLRAIGTYPGQRGLDVGCGTGGLTHEMAQLFGPENTRAIDPSPAFVERTRERVWGVEVTEGRVEELPYPDAHFEVVMAQLVLDLPEKPGPGVLEMRRVSRPGGVVAGCVWDYGGEMTMLRAFWDAATAIDPEGAGPLDEGKLLLASQHQLGELWRACGFRAVSLGHVVVSAFYKDFADCWAPFAAGVGPSGAYAASLGPEEQEALRAEFYKRLGSPEGFFELTAKAWYVAGS